MRPSLVFGALIWLNVGVLNSLVEQRAVPARRVPPGRFRPRGQVWNHHPGHQRRWPQELPRKRHQTAQGYVGKGGGGGGAVDPIEGGEICFCCGGAGACVVIVLLPVVFVGEPSLMQDGGGGQQQAPPPPPQ